MPPPDPPIFDVAPTDRNLTAYDEEHLVTYLRLLDADAEGADWQEVAKIVLHIDPEREPDRAKRASRAIWFVRNGWRRTVIAIFCAAVRLIEFLSLPSSEQLRELISSIFVRAAATRPMSATGGKLWRSFEPRQLSLGILN
jgi:anti-sigma-K factor RskA